jgi:hypothetical protein
MAESKSAALPLGYAPSDENASPKAKHARCIIGSARLCNGEKAGNALNLCSRADNRTFDDRGIVAHQINVGGSRAISA